MFGESDDNLDIQHYLSIKYRIKPITTHQTPITTPNSNLKEDQQFFAYVRNRKYKQAFILGQNIIKNRPNNNTVASFCEFLNRNFIQNGEQINNQTLHEQEEQSDESQSTSSEDDEEDETQSEQNSKDEISENSELQKSQSEIPQEEVNQRKEEGSLFKKNKKQNENNEGQKKNISNPYIPKLALSTTPKIKVRKIENKEQKINSKKMDLQNRGSADKIKNEEKKLTSEKDLVKNIINIKLNQQNNYDRQRRYKNTTMAGNASKKCVKLPWIKNKFTNIQPTNIMVENKQNVAQNESKIKQNRHKYIVKVKQNEKKMGKESEGDKRELGIVQEQRQQNKELNDIKLKRNSYKVSSNCIKNKLDEKRMSINSINFKVFENIKMLNRNASACENKTTEGQST